MTYLQSSQYKLLKAYRALDSQAKKERLINTMTAAIRSSLSPEAVLQTAIEELGQVFEQCRCILYRCQLSDLQVTIEYEAVDRSLSPLKGKSWDIADNPLIQVAMMQEHPAAIHSVTDMPILQTHAALKATVQRLKIRSWLLAPIRYQGNFLGMVELHYKGADPYHWSENDISLVEAISTQAGVALTQAEAYAASETLNQKLQALERTQNNLIKIVGHELRTPLSTIQICLESLESEPEIAPELRQGHVRDCSNRFLPDAPLDSGFSDLISLGEQPDIFMSRTHSTLRNNWVGHQWHQINWDRNPVADHSPRTTARITSSPY